jgi:hypothetical protein
MYLYVLKYGARNHEPKIDYITLNIYWPDSHESVDGGSKFLRNVANTFYLHAVASPPQLL